MGAKDGLTAYRGKRHFDRTREPGRPAGPLRTQRSHPEAGGRRGGHGTGRRLMRMFGARYDRESGGVLGVRDDGKRPADLVRERPAGG